MTGLWRRASAVLLAATMVLPLGAFLGSRSEARDITYFSGGAAGFTVDITPPGTVAPNSLVLPQYSYVSSASLKVSTHAGGDPRAPADISLDVGGDGSPEWAFNGTGAGAFGFQDQASDGSTSLTLRYDRKGYQSFSVRLPSGANVTNATLDISGALDNVTFGTANVTGANDFDLFGISVAGGVDINGDGYDDVMVGAPDGDTHGLTDNGYLNVYYGSLNGPSTVPGDTLSGAESGDAFGFSCAGVHDFNGDGYGEVLAGAPLATPKPSVVPATGVAYLYAYDGVQGRFRNLPIHTISGSGESGQMGFSVAEVADIDRDNRSDIAGGEILANRSVVQPYLGRVAVLRSSDPTGNPDNLWGDAAYSFFGCFMAKARDLDGDKKADFLVGAKINTPSGPMGSVYLFLSRQDFKNPTVILGTQGWSTFGTSGCTGDFNGDGFEDIAIGAPDTRFGGDDKTFGAVLIYSGDPKGIDPLQKPMVLRGRQNGTEYGYSLACPGDLDGDGTDDLLIGIPGSITNSSGDPGAVDVFLTGRALNITLNGDFTDEHFGLSVAAAGDVNRDGLRDFVVGAPTAPLGNRSAVGRAITFLTRLAGPWNPKMNVGDTGADDWSWQGPFVRGVRVPDFSKKLNALLFGAQSVSVDGYGNEFTDVTISVYSDRPGAMTISNISIAYNWTATVDVNPESASGNLTWALNNLLTHARSDPPDQLIPLVFNATSAGAVTVRGLEVTIDEAPVARAAPVVTMHEDGSDAYLLDLYTIFSDDHDGGDLLFTIDDYTNGDFVQVSLTDQRWLSVDAYNGTENDNWTGETVVHVSAGDSRWLFNSTDVTVQIAPVNDPPAFTSSPPLGARAGARYVYQLTAVDAENGTLSYGLLNGPAGMRVGRSSGLVEWIPAQAQFNQTFEVELFVSDGELCATQSFSVTVGTRLDGVGMAGTPPPTAVVGEEYLFDPRGFTDVPNATVTFNILSGPAGMSVLPNGTLRWVPAESQVGTAAVQLEATDGYFTSTLGWNISVFEAGTPRSGLTCAIREPAEGKKVSGKVTFRGVANITVGAISGVEVRVDRKDWTEAAGLADWSYVLDTTKLSNGRHTVYARAWDGKSHSQNATVTVDVENVQASAGLLSGPLLWLALAVVIIAAAAVMVALYLRRPAPKAPPGAPPAAVRNGEELAVEDVFLILLDGRLIHHATRRLAIGVDSDILSSMLTAVTSFVKDALARTGEGNLGSLEYGENKIILERGRWTFIAVVITGRREPPELRDEMKQAIANVESEYASVLPGWDGNHAALSSVKKFLGPVTSFTMAQAAASGAVNAAGVDVTVSGELEFYQGYVRLKVAVKNSSPAFIMDSALRIIYNDKALRLERIEPEYPVTGREIMLGNIGIREKKTVALYLDPQICTESRIEGTLTFKDAQGEMHHADMKRKLASVVCPIMYSDQNINVPMLQRLLESELDQKDSKVFSLPQGLGPEGAFELCKRAVQGHDIRLVREFVDREPFVGEAWYFGKVKGRGDRLVVKTAVRADTASAEFYVASNSRLVVTGLLAELKNDLNKEYRREKGGESDVEAMADESRRERVRKAGSLLDKYAQGEAAPGSIGPPEMNR